MKKIIIIVLAALVLGGAGAYFIFSPKPAPEPKKSIFAGGESFITNIKNSKSLCKASVDLEYDSTAEAEKKAAFLTEKSAVIRNEIIFILREKTEDELRSSGIQDTLRNEIVKKINEKLGIDYIQSIYFKDYVIQ